MAPHNGHQCDWTLVYRTTQLPSSSRTWLKLPHESFYALLHSTHSGQSEKTVKCVFQRHRPFKFGIKRTNLGTDMHPIWSRLYKTCLEQAPFQALGGK